MLHKEIGSSALYTAYCLTRASKQCLCGSLEHFVGIVRIFASRHQAFHCCSVLNQI